MRTTFHVAFPDVVRKHDDPGFFSIQSISPGKDPGSALGAVREGKSWGRDIAMLRRSTKL